MRSVTEPSEIDLELGRFRKVDEQAIDHTIKHNLELYILAEEVADMYRKMFKFASESKTERVIGVHEASSFVLGTAAYYTQGMLTLIRKHVSDSYYYLRKAIELVAFANSIKRKPEMRQIWDIAPNTLQDYRNYKALFNTKEIFQGIDELFPRYDYASRLAHSSKHGISPHIQEEGDEKYSSFPWDAFTDTVDIGFHIVYAIETHLMIMQIARIILESRLSHRQSDWDEINTKISEKLAKEKVTIGYQTPTR